MTLSDPNSTNRPVPTACADRVYCFAVGVAVFCVVLVFISGCGGPNIRAGTPLLYSDIASNVTLAATSVSQTFIRNQDGFPVSGLVITDASLIRNATDFTNSPRKLFVVFDDWFFGNLALISYNRSQAEKRRGLDIPVYNSSKTRVQIVTLDASKRVVQVQRWKAAHVQLSVDTNDFPRVWPNTLRAEELQPSH